MLQPESLSSPWATIGSGARGKRFVMSEGMAGRGVRVLVGVMGLLEAGMNRTGGRFVPSG